MSSFHVHSQNRFGHPLSNFASGSNYGRETQIPSTRISAKTLDYSQTLFPYKGIEPPANLLTSLYPHQSETVEWMLYREELPWENMRGGLVLHQMGLGKTLCVLACISVAKGSTLIIVPAQLVYVWESEIKRHFKDSLSYFAYHGTNRKQRFEKYLLNFGEPEVMIMSFQSIPTDIEDVSGPLNNINFHRIVYDECHYIKNRQTKVFRAVFRIKSPIKWFLSGTPIMNKIQEMYPYLQLLNYKHLKSIVGGNPGGHNQLVRRMNFGYDDKKIKTTNYIQMQKILSNIAIRRTKEILDLPEKSYKNVFVNLDGQEKTFYQTLKTYSQSRLKKLFKNIRRINNSGLPPEEQTRLRLIVLQCMLLTILYLRLACNDPLMVIDKIPRTTGLDISKTIKILGEPFDNDCPVCFNNDATVLDTSCQHSACSDCWNKLGKMPVMRCFTCLEETEKTNLQDNTVVDENKMKDAHDNRILHRSTKSLVVLQKISNQLSRGNKVVVVSQWTTYLDKLVKQFKCEHRDVKFVVLDGKTAPAKRQKFVDEFQDSDEVRVCFASLGSSAEGITLHSACSMILCDVYWNKAKIEQISDRVHRIGQTKKVKVYCIYVLDSIEMKLKKLVDKKDIICKVIVDCAPVTGSAESWLTRIIKLVE